MSPRSSDDGSDIAPPSQNSIRREAELMYEVIDKDNLKYMGKEEDVIAVVRSESVASLKSMIKTSIFNRFIRGDSEPRVVVSNNERLRDAIKKLGKSQRERKLRILVTPKIGSIYFEVPSQFTTLMIFRCGHGDPCSKGPCGRLRIDSSSTFAGVQVGNWDQQERVHKLFIGEGVGVPSSFDKFSFGPSSVHHLSSSEKEELYQHFQDMRNTDMSGKWWREWRGKVAAILGITIGAGKAMVGMNATVTGVFIDMKYGLFALKAGGFYAKAGAMITAAGPAVALGVGVAAAVYFIPWDHFFSWLGDLISRFFGWLWKLWQDFMEWVSDKIECLRSHVASRMWAGRRPMIYN